MKLIDIALATYNGASFIQEQIESIINQSYKNWRLLISDDASTDETVDVVKNFASIDDRIHIVNTVRQGGVVANFNTALSNTTADLVVLSDQDDIWPTERLETMVEAFEKQLKQKKMENKPFLLFTDLTLVDSDNKVIANSFYKANNIDPNENITNNNLLWRSTVYGCTTMMNRKLLDIALPIPGYSTMHDQWLALNAYRYGGLTFFNYSSIRYRQHSNNVVGGSHKGFYYKLASFSKSFEIISKSAQNTAILLHEKPDLSALDYPVNNKKDIVKFSLREVLPYAFKGSRKVYALFSFIGFLKI
ncbi:MAG TPA: glycosyltransferase family 2 protein [Scandinavium sp.]|jgi:glycosyltransferase involved in cell wall biosynthesis